MVARKFRAKDCFNGMPDVTLVKLGGSLITDKNRPQTARGKVIERLAQEIASAKRKRSDGLLLGHGSGSFGHSAAAEAGLGNGPVKDNQRRGISTVQIQAARLHWRVVEALKEAGALPFSIAPSSAFITSGGRVTSVATEPVTRALDLGLLPVLYGDIVPDRRWGAAILSTEVVLLELAQRLRRRMFRIRHILWLGDTPGLYGADGKTLAKITPTNYDEAREAIHETHGTDVTGGMALRLDTAWKLSSQGITSWLLDGREEGLLRRCLEGKKVPGTEIPGRNIARRSSGRS